LAGAAMVNGSYRPIADFGDGPFSTQNSDRKRRKLMPRGCAAARLFLSQH